MTKAEAIDVSTFFTGQIGSSGENDITIGWGYPSEYQEVWYKFLLPNYYEAYNSTVWNIGGPYYTPYPPLDDEWMPPAPAKPGIEHPCNVVLYDAADNVMATGQHIQFTTQGRFNTWVYFKITQPAPHYAGWIYCDCRFRIARMNRSIITPGTIIVQGDKKLAVLHEVAAGPGPFHVSEAHVHNYVFPELTGHSVGGEQGDILLTGVNCIEDTVAGGITVRSKAYLAAVTFAFAPGTIINDIACNADRVSDFWVSYTENGVHKCRAVKIISEGISNYEPVVAQLGPVMGITSKVVRLRARTDQVLYYNEEGSINIQMWDIKNNVFIKTIYSEPLFGPVADILVVPGGDLLVGYNSQTNPSYYTIRRVTGIEAIYVRDYQFTSQSTINRMNYTQNNEVLCLWTHEILGKSTFRFFRLSDGVVTYTTANREYENDSLVLANDLYIESYMHPTLQRGSPTRTTQPNGHSNKYNFWIHPVYVYGNSNSTNGEGLMYVEIGTQPPPDDEFYPPVFPPYNPPTYPIIGGNPPVPAPEPPPEVPPYPGYPWLPPPPPLPNDPPLKPPNVVPLPVKIGGGLIILDPQNVSRTDVYQSTEGLTLNVPIKVNIRTAYLGD